MSTIQDIYSLDNITIDNIPNILNKEYIDIIKYNSNDLIYEIIKKYFNKLDSIIKTYKNKTLYIHLETIIKYISYINKDEILLYNIILNISNCMHGQVLLNKLNSIIYAYSEDTIISIINSIAREWTFPVFMYYNKLCSNNNIDLTKHTNYIIKASFENSDDRIYKYIIDNNMYNINNINKTDIFIKNIIRAIGEIKAPKKYILKRLYYLNKIIPDLYNYLDYIWDDIVEVTYINISYILKYYYTSTYILSADKLLALINNFSYNTSNLKQNFEYVYHKLNTLTEKNMLVIGFIIKYGTSFSYKIISGNENHNIEFMDIIFTNRTHYNPWHNKSINQIEFYDIINSFDKTIISSITTINNHYDYEYSINLFLIPYVIASKGEHCKQFNIIRHFITKIIKKYKQQKNMIKKIRISPILNELASLKPINNISVFKDGTNFYKSKQQLFNTITPYHLYPGQLQNMDNNINYLIKQKADGVLVYNLPSNIYPNNNFNKVKAEYIEELDLYLVFDIDIKSSIFERHIYIHNTHKYGQSSVPIINNMDELYNFINIENTKLNEFLKEPYDNYRWYPKPAWMINNIFNFINPLTDFINMKNTITQLNIYPCDGFILTPLNGSREIKIKPKNLYTIDILYKTNKWVDRDGFNWDIKVDNIELIDNSIWRCYPIDGIYYAKEIRFDKSKPNPNHIVSNIINLYNSSYEYNYIDIYNEQHTNDLIWKDIINDNNKIIKMMVKHIKNSENVLDCGCGSGRILKYLNNFNKYYGIDADINMLGKAINKYIDYDNIFFSACDLKLGLDGWYNVSNYKFDTIIMINSVMHFSNDNFWLNINKVSKSNTKLLLNVFEMDNMKYEFNEYFIERIDSIVRYKFPIHKNIKEEMYIDIKTIFDKYGWTILYRYQPDTNNLTKFYTWYIAVKN